MRHRHFIQVPKNYSYTENLFGVPFVRNVIRIFAAVEYRKFIRYT